MTDRFNNEKRKRLGVIIAVSYLIGITFLIVNFITIIDGQYFLISDEFGGISIFSLTISGVLSSIFLIIGFISILYALLLFNKYWFLIWKARAIAFCLFGITLNITFLMSYNYLLGILAYVLIIGTFIFLMVSIVLLFSESRPLSKRVFIALLIGLLPLILASMGIVLVFFIMIPIGVIFLIATIVMILRKWRLKELKIKELAPIVVIIILLIIGVMFITQFFFAFLINVCSRDYPYIKTGMTPFNISKIYFYCGIGLAAITIFMMLLFLPSSEVKKQSSL